MYKSPIEVIMTEMQTQFDDGIYNAIQGYGVVVDKEELIKALEYDRDQYDTGFVEGAIAFATYLKGQSFHCDPGNGFSFDALDVDELDDYVKRFLRR
jgi:hypothetical protein